MSEDQLPVFFTSFDELKNNLEAEHLNDQPILNLISEKSKPDDEQWFAEDYEGQMSVDIYQTADDIILKSTIAGVKPEDLEIYVHDDLLTIRGKREEEKKEEGADYLYKECYWGGFSRSIILPMEVQIDKIKATYKNGVLKIVMPKAAKAKQITVEVNEE